MAYDKTAYPRIAEHSTVNLSKAMKHCIAFQLLQQGGAAAGHQAKCGNLQRGKNSFSLIDNSLIITIYNLHFAIYNLQFTIYYLHFAIYNLQFTIYNLHFAIYNLQ